MNFKHIAIAGALVASALTAQAGPAELCKTMGEAARNVAVLKDEGKPASVARQLARENLDGPLLKTGLALVNAIYRNDWTPVEAHSTVRTMCLSSFAS